MFRTTFTFRIARYSFRTKAIHTSFDTKFVSAQFALKFVNAQCVYVNLAGCADWQIGNSDPALLILLTLNLTSRIKNEMIPAIIPMNIFGKYVNVHVKWTVNIILARLWNVAVAVVGFETGTGRAVTCYKPRPVIRSMYDCVRVDVHISFSRSRSTRSSFETKVRPSFSYTVFSYRTFSYRTFTKKENSKRVQIRCCGIYWPRPSRQ